MEMLADAGPPVTTSHPSPEIQTAATGTRPPRNGGMLEIHGPALRAIRMLTGINAAELALAIGISRPYLAKLELGQRRRVSPMVYRALIRALALDDWRSLLAHPYGADPADVQDAAENGNAVTLEADTDRT